MSTAFSHVSWVLYQSRTDCNVEDKYQQVFHTAPESCSNWGESSGHKNNP